MLEDSSGIEQGFGLSTDFADTMFLPACIEEMVESENYTDARFSENYFCPAESVISKKASLAYHTDKESVIIDWQDKYESEIKLDSDCVKVLQNQLHMDASNELISSSTCTKYPLSSTSSTSASPTGTLTPLEQQNELWQAIGSLDVFFMDKDIIEACEISNADESSNDDLLGTPSVSFAEFLQQYNELTDWLKQVHETTQREVTCLSEKYLNLSYHEEMLERSPRRQFLNDYSRQLLLRCPKVTDEVNDKMATLNAQWADLEHAVCAKRDVRNTEAMLADLQSDMRTLRQWLTEVESVLLPLTIKDSWTDAELEEKLQIHKVLQQDIESHNRIVKAVLQLSQQFDYNARGFGKDGVRNSFHLVALNLQRCWHGVWLQSLECQCRLEEFISRRKSCHKNGLDFSGCPLPVVDESSLSNSSSSTDIHNLVGIDDDDFLFISHPDDSTNSASLRTQFQHEGFKPIITDRHKSSALVFHDTLSSDYINVEVHTPNDHDNLSASLKSGDGQSNISTVRESESSSVLFAVLAQDRSYAKQKLSNFSTIGKRPQSVSTSALRGHAESVSPVESFSNIRYSYIKNSDAFPDSSPVTKDNDHICLTSSKFLFDLSSGDSANISESESKMGDFPPFNGLLAGEAEDLVEHLTTSSEGEGEPLAAENSNTLEVKDIGYSSDSLSNDEDDVLHHQIGIECKFPGKCEVASDGPLGDKITLPSVAARPEYYFMTLVDIDSTDKTDNGDTTDSGGERMKKYTGQYRMKSAVDVPRLELLKNCTREDKSNNRIENYSHSLDDSWDAADLTATSFSDRFFEETQALHESTFELPLEDECSGLTYEFSDSDIVVDSKMKKIKYLIDHAEDLVKYPSPHKQQPKSPSKHTQTDPLITVESSCDASGEDNSEFESHLKNGLAKEELSTATDDADETLFNSVIHIGSAEESMRSDDLDQTILLSPYSPVIYDSPHLRKQTCRRRHQKGECRPWSVVGLDNINLSKKFTNEVHRISAGHRISAVSESAINHLHFQTNKLPSWLFMSSQSMTPCNDSHSWSIHRTSTSCDQTSPQLEFSALHTLQSTSAESTFSPSYRETIQNSDGSLATLSQPLVDVQLPSLDISFQTSLHKTSSRRSLCKVSREKHKTKQSTQRCSWASDVFDSAESEPKTGTSDEYQTAPLKLATSDGDDVHNVSGSLSESSAWDNYQMLYPTASEDPSEDLLTWERQDELEFDDDFLLKHRKGSLVKNGMTSVHKHAELSVSRSNLLCEDSDSELDDFHHILDQSELALKKAEQSLKKMGNNPVSLGHKYDEIFKMYETSMRCLKSICQHLKSENVPENDVKRVQALMSQWEDLHNLATEYHTHAKFLNDVADFIVEVENHIQEVDSCVTFDGLTTSEDLKKVITLLEERKTILKQQEEQLNRAYKQMMEFSALHSMKQAEKYSQELSHIKKAIAEAINTVSDRVEQQTERLEYLERQHRLNVSLTTDRERLHNLQCQQQYRMHINKKDVLNELEILRNNLSLHESQLSLLQSMWVPQIRNSDPSAQDHLLASLRDLRNQLFLMKQRCCQINRDIEDDETLLDQQSDFGQLAMYTTALHEVVSRPRNPLSRSSSFVNLPATSGTGSKFTHSCASWLCSFPAQVVALMLVTGLICALDPDILDRLTNLTLKISPELHYVNGPPPT